jgi:hypothetical protein
VEAFEDIRCKQMRAGSQRLDQMHRVESGGKLPVSGSLVHAMAEARLQEGGQRNVMIAIAVMLGFYSAMRVGEYVGSDTGSAESHVVESQDVCFLLSGPDAVVPGRMLSLGDTRRVRGLQVTLRSAKNDQRGSGNTWSFYKSEVVRGNFFIAQMARWAATARSEARDPFISWRSEDGKRTSLGYRVFNEAVKEAARRGGFDASEFSTHSLRIGALTQLSAAGLPVETARRVARHKSAASTVKYQAESTAERGRVLRALGADDSWGELDIRALAAGRKGRDNGHTSSMRDAKEKHL